MVKRNLRTSKQRRYRTPGGDVRIEYHKRKHVKLRCAMCGRELHGVPTMLKGKSKSEKVPNRPYAGIYCSSCMRKVIRDKVYESVKAIGE